MRRRILQFGRALVALALGSGVAAALSGPRDAWAQTGTITCWAESCSGNVCVRVQIECPPVVKPVVVPATQ